jgi:hypothetical protein
MLGKLTNDEALLVLGTLRRVASAMRLHLSHAFAPVSHAPARSRVTPPSGGLWAGRHGGQAAERWPAWGYPVVQGEQQGRRA